MAMEPRCELVASLDQTCLDDHMLPSDSEAGECYSFGQDFFGMGSRCSELLNT